MQHQRPTYKTPGPVLTGTALSFMIRGSNQAPTSLTTPPHKPSIEPKKPSARPHRIPRPRNPPRIVEPATRKPAAAKSEPEAPKVEPKVKAASVEEPVVPKSEPETQKPQKSAKGKKKKVDPEEKEDPVLVIPPPAEEPNSSSDEDESVLKSVSESDEEQESVGEKEAEEEESSSDEEDDNKSVQSTKKPKGRGWATTFVGAAAGVIKSGAGLVANVVSATYKKGVYESDIFYMFDDNFKQDGALLQIREVLEQHMQHLVNMEVFMQANTMCYYYRKQWSQWFVQEFNTKFSKTYRKITEKNLNKFYKNLKYKLSDDDYAKTSSYNLSDNYTNQKYLYFIHGWGKLLPLGDYTNYNAFFDIIEKEKSTNIPNEYGGYETIYHNIQKDIILPPPGPIILETSSYKTEYKALAQRIALLVKEFEENPEYISLIEIKRDEILTNYPFVALQKRLEEENWSVAHIV